MPEQIASETSVLDAIRRLRRDRRNTEDHTLLGYQTADGCSLSFTGDTEGVYTKIIGIFSTVVMPVGGDIAHDAADVATSFPLKIGAHATADERAAVDEDDRVDLSADLSGRLRVWLSDVAHDAVDDDDNPIKIGGTASNATPAAVANGDRVRAYFDLNGRLMVGLDQLLAGEDLTNNVLAITEEPLAVAAHAADSTVTITALVSNVVVKASAGRIFAVRMLLSASAGADRWLFILNDNAAPGAGDDPIWRAVLPNGSLEVSEELPIGGLYCSTGIVVAISTTHLTYTAPGAAEATFSTLYK